MSVRALDISRVTAPAGGELHLFYGSQTGNGEAIAEALAASATQSGIRVISKSLSDLRPAQLKKIHHAAFVMSTHGDGDPPDDALDLFEWLESGNGKDLAALGFRILALGDRSYAEFCAAGRRLANLLRARGAGEFAPMVECDVDYEAEADRWSGELLQWAQENLDSGAANDSTQNSMSTPLAAPRFSLVHSTPGWTRARPFPALVDKVQKITGLESGKDVYHLELSIEGSGIAYEPGDSLGVWADNDAELVSRLLRFLGIDPAERVDDGGRERTIRDTLTRRRDLTRLHFDSLERWSQLETTRGRGGLLRKLRQFDSEARKAFLEARQFSDLAEEFPFGLTAQELADLLPALGPRSYSIASSRALVDEAVHLTVVTQRSNAIGQERHGLASGFLNRRVHAGDEVRLFLEPNHRFRLPESSNAPIIMIGAGTGIAPYRAFLQELEARGDSPPAWLIFGNPHRRTDFLYQREWLKWRSDGLVNRIDGAFSRDQAPKRYVQHVVREQGAEISRWIEDGAYIYLCGALAMGHAVELALVDAIGTERSLVPEAAAEVVKDLRRQRRLLKDLY